MSILLKQNHYRGDSRCIWRKRKANTPLGFVTIRDTAFGKVVWGDLQGNVITRCNFNEELAHFARNMRQNLVPILQLNLVHRCWKHLYDYASYFNCIIT